MTIWPFSNDNTQNQKSHEQNEPPEQQAMVAPPPIPMMIGHNFPKDLEMKINTTKPYIFASLVSWPFYWLYRGLEWGRHRENVKLPAYIHRTHLQAKFLQFAIILTGITMASLESIRRHMNTSGTNSSR
uniref:HIG1 domain-containing protein n=1 Tax=Musca domestica TaxID=7370 RepID=A0A1I8MK11_MUSDO